MSTCGSESRDEVFDYELYFSSHLLNHSVSNINSEKRCIFCLFWFRIKCSIGAAILTSLNVHVQLFTFSVPKVTFLNKPTPYGTVFICCVESEDTEKH